MSPSKNVTVPSNDDQVMDKFWNQLAKFDFRMDKHLTFTYLLTFD